MKYFILLLLIPLLFPGCSDSNGFISDISRACHSSMFSPTPNSPCPAEGFIGIGGRGASCLCESETGEKFLRHR